MPASSASRGRRVLEAVSADDHVATLDLLQAGQRVDQFRLAVSVDACDPDDLPGANVERDAANLLDSPVVADVQIPNLEKHVAGRVRLLLDAEEHLATDHRLRERLLGSALARHRLDRLPAPQDRDPVGDLEHLVELVA